MVNCPHCGKAINGSSLIGSSFWRPYVCPACAQASRVVRPFGQTSLLTMLGVFSGLASARLLPFPYYLFALGVIVLVLWTLDAWLLGHTAKLAPVLPSSPADEA